MKTLAIAAISLAALASTANASPQNGWPKWYVGLSGGIAGQTDSDVDGGDEFEYDNGYVASVALGYNPGTTPFRVEAEYTNRKQDFDNGSGDITANSVALNGYYDFANESVITPYLGAGLGWSNFEVSESNTAGIDGSDSKPIYQLMAGVGYESDMLPSTSFTLGYRYFAPFSDPGEDGTNFEYDNHSVELGAKFWF